MQEYIASVSANINAMTNKMIWSAHCRAVNLLANAGKDGAPFWDIGSFDRDIFAEFDPEYTASVAHKMNESWHRTAPKPFMVRYTMKDYPIGCHSSPFEEINEVADTLFSGEAFGSSLPAGRPVKCPTKRKGKGRGMPGASVRDPAIFTLQDNWLAPLIPLAKVQEHREAFPEEAVTSSIAEDTKAIAEPRILSDLLRLDLTGVPLQISPTKAHQSNADATPTGLTQLERLFEESGADALSGHHHTNDNAPSQGHIDQVPTWPLRLLNDHRRRLTQESPQVFRRALPGIRAVIAEAISQGYRPVNPDFEELIVDIKFREQSEAAVVQVSKAYIAQHDRVFASERQKESQHGKKRMRDQPAPIRMFDKPIKPSKKKRKVDESVLSVAGASNSTEPTRSPRKQKAITTGPSTLAFKANKPAKKKASQHSTAVHNDPTPLPPHPSGSETLESHQQLPPAAYFEPRSPSEKPVWRCAIKHALGLYYNAGDRKNCPGCFTALSDNINAKVMDFYLPSRTHFYQPDLISRWRPSKPLRRARRSAHCSHNSIAKDAYWDAIAEGANDDEARKLAVDAVTARLAPKPRKEPTPEPTPEPGPDLGPHPSGSSTMEHGQDLPKCAYASKRDCHEELAWRCDVNHALGRYYLAGDKRSCPGCGSNKNGSGRHLEMDFYMPTGVVVRQEMDEVKWKPKKPYKIREGSKKKTEKATTHTHNQVASRKYLEAIDAGKTQEDALVFALEETDRYLDEKENEAFRKAEQRDKAQEAKSRKTASKRNTLTSSSALNALRKRIARTSRAQPATDESEQSDNDKSPSHTIFHRRRAIPNDNSDEDTDDPDSYQTDHEMSGAGPVEQAVETSSDDETSSGSDSE